MYGPWNSDQFAGRPAEPGSELLEVNETFTEVCELLAEHPPAWYTEHIHERTRSALHKLEKQVAPGRRLQPITRVDRAKSWLRGLAVVALLSLGGISYVVHMDKSAAMLLMLILILLFTKFGKIVDAIVLAGLSAGMLSYFFLAPIHSFSIQSSSDQASLAVFVVAAIASSLLVKGHKAAR